MIFTARTIADYLKGTVEGNENVEVSGVSKIDEGKKGTLSFLANPKYEHFLYETESTIVLVNSSLRLEKEINTTLIRVDDAYKSFASLLDLYQQSKPVPSGISDKASITESAKIGENIYIGDFSVVSDKAEIGDNTLIYPQVFIGNNVKIGCGTTINPGVVIYHDCIIGDNCILHSGVVIGSDGFGFAPQTGGEHKKIPQIGNVVIEDNVEIGANTVVDRATMGSTIIHKGAKLDNFIQIAHNVEIGERTFMAAHCGVSGSTKIGKDCLIGGQVGFVGHISVADNVKIGAQTGVTSSITEDGATMQGSPAMKIVSFQRSSILFKKLPELNRQLAALQKEVDELKKKYES